MSDEEMRRLCRELIRRGYGEVDEPEPEERLTPAQEVASRTEPGDRVDLTHLAGALVFPGYPRAWAESSAALLWGRSTLTPLVVGFPSCDTLPFAGLHRHQPVRVRVVPWLEQAPSPLSARNNGDTGALLVGVVSELAVAACREFGGEAGFNAYDLYDLYDLPYVLIPWVILELSDWQIETTGASVTRAMFPNWS